MPGESIVQTLSGVLVAVVTGTFTSLGWYVTSLLSRKRQVERDRVTHKLRYLEAQIKELYGPLVALLEDSKSVYELATNIIRGKGSNGRIDLSNLSEQDVRPWNYLTEHFFLPNNRRIQSLLLDKAHLLCPATEHEVPSFLRHRAHFECLHMLAKDEGISNISFHGSGWPEKLEQAARQDLGALRTEYRSYLQGSDGRRDRPSSSVVPAAPD